MPTKTPRFVITYSVTLILAVLSISIGQAANAESHKLAYKFQAGQSVSFSVDHQAKVYLQQEEAEQHIEHGSITDKRYMVKSVDAQGNAILELQIDRVRMKASVDGGDEISHDTDSDAEPPTQLQGIAETVGQPHVRVKVSPSGELLSIKWLIGGQQMPKPTKDDAATLDILVVLPETPIQVGDSWKQQFDAEVGVGTALKKKVTIQRKYTLKQVAGDLATIDLKTVVITPLYDPAQESQIVNKTPRGTIVFDIKRGVLVSRKLAVDKVVVGFNGPNSKVHNISTRTEKLLPTQIAADSGTDSDRR